jgi:transcriptional regulator with XRE-family HTH domain
MLSPLQDKLDLKALRQQASLTQSDLAIRLGVAQSQIQRYEREPENVSWRIVVEWMAACGQPFVTAAGVDPGLPYAAADRGLELLRGYKANEHEPLLKTGDVIRAPIGLDQLEAALRQQYRMPRLVLCGRIAAGKSRCANTLLGIDKLPTAYVHLHATWVVILVRHLKRKPKWQKEPVWLLDESCSLDDVDREEVYTNHRIRAGDFDTLRLYGADGAADTVAKPGEKMPGYAVAYVDSPILEACEIIDTPGLGYTGHEDALADATRNGGDVVLYLSPLNRMLDAEDMHALPLLVERLAAPAGRDENPLARLFILATHAHPAVSDADAEQAVSRAADRLYQALNPQLTRQTLGQEGGIRRPPITYAQLRARCFVWYAETPARREPVLSGLKELLLDMARSTLSRLDETVSEFRGQADRVLGEEVARLERLFTARDAAEPHLSEIVATEPDREKSRRCRRAEILRLIDHGRSKTAAFLESEVAPLLAEPALLDVAKSFKDQDEAKRDVANTVLTRIRLMVTEALDREAAPLTAEIEAYLEGFSFRIPSGATGSFLPFDARAVFFGAVAGVGTFGALAAWVAFVAEGSSLGAYFVVPQVVGLFARLGIGIAGGTATGVSIISALGGPVGIGIGIAVRVALVAWQVFGRSWHQRLASALAEHFKKNKVMDEIVKQCSEFWDTTIVAFEKASDETERQYAAHMRSLEEQVALSKFEIESRLARVRNRCFFLHYLPWSPVGAVPA